MPQSKTKQTQRFKEYWAEYGRGKDRKRFLSNYNDWWNYQEWRRSRKTSDRRIKEVA